MSLDLNWPCFVILVVILYQPMGPLKRSYYTILAGIEAQSQP